MLFKPVFHKTDVEKTGKHGAHEIVAEHDRNAFTAVIGGEAYEKAAVPPLRKGGEGLAVYHNGGNEAFPFCGKNVIRNADGGKIAFLPAEKKGGISV